MILDELYMRRCLQLAEMGAGTVSPNPMVGAVIVHDQQIVGEGYTSPYGGPHAEVNAVQEVITKYGETDAAKMLKNSTIYVSLEPCAHFGKTPPCADMLARYQLQKVVIACQDPFAKVNGAGVQRLQDAGIEVVLGLLEQEAQWLNRRFFTRLEQQRPYVILKWAQTSNGFLASLEPKQQWISNSASQQLVHKWRAEEDAILVGTRTALIDNPSLTVRDWVGSHPKRVLIDKNLSVAADASILNAEVETLVFNAKKTDWSTHVKYIELENFDLYLPHNILYQLHLMDVQSIIIEGGSKTHQMFIDAGLWDEARIFSADFEWENGLPAPTVNGRLVEKMQVGNDSLEIICRA
ncbi:bifunctional diaminohydroxyphosphoribosylaminopyrimidine deaminase/5-amino-6-(5-phosphoribosylamino)uracil reductase RibD [Sphingobacterium chungjuense]|uniref:bifunctional diaminohydroxyphosphoribosylaminopyrimidine deaminase/5-amino-6-(5-phosphoribosylamino)uracil reductase RibD n=1 Tax=Sphingobacterium chungjuense TaxID=2675553 RepID=UPI001409DA38|nr:bifunctional diaminohydroxyphosphoribosylaminopyrimidine deaminase/5-amino-6-(5-phosphoribosylamino)uracil reductase RibD [Sphingobacterium chungjuense]